MKAKELSRLVQDALEDLKAYDIRFFDVRRLTSITDIMIIASGNSDRQVKALANKVLDSMKEHHIKPLGVEGVQQGDWALLDLGDVIVHIMRPVVREYYQLEKLWSPDNQQKSSA